jgi:hypothetical protein
MAYAGYNMLCKVIMKYFILELPVTEETKESHVACSWAILECTANVAKSIPPRI